MRAFVVDAVGRTHPGLVRSNNEDSFHIGDNLLVVADGIGGAAAGEIASHTLVSVFAGVQRAESGDDLYRILAELVDRSSNEIRDLVEADPDLEGMGTTATAMMWAPDRIVVANVGDSRAYYLQSGGRTPLRQITHDDSFVQYLVDTGVIRPQQAGNHPRRNVILKAINGLSVTPTFSTLAPLVGDRYLLCSDGLSDYVADGDIGDVLAGERDRAAAADALVELALAAGAPDNVTVVVADVTGTDGAGAEPAGGDTDASTIPIDGAEVPTRPIPRVGP